MPSETAEGEAVDGNCCALHRQTNMDPQRFAVWAAADAPVLSCEHRDVTSALDPGDKKPGVRGNIRFLMLPKNI